MDKKIKKVMTDLVDIAYQKGYTKEEAQIIGTIVCSKTAVSLGYDSLSGLNLGLEYVNKYDNGRDCINALIEIIK